jgi:hypothetical protein
MNAQDLETERTCELDHSETKHDGRISRAGRRLRSVGEWWREPRNGKLRGRNYDTSQATTKQPSDAGWVPAFHKSVAGSGPRCKVIAKKRSLHNFAKRLVAGSSFIRCESLIAEEEANSKKEHSEPFRLSDLSAAPKTPCLKDADILASAMRASHMQDDTSATPIRRVLHVSASSDEENGEA